jgi:hypothetical protein
VSRFIQTRPRCNLLNDKLEFVASHWGVNVAGFIGNVRSGGKNRLKT